MVISPAGYFQGYGKKANNGSYQTKPLYCLKIVLKFNESYRSDKAIFKNLTFQRHCGKVKGQTMLVI